MIFQFSDDHARYAVASHVAWSENAGDAIVVFDKGVAAHGVPQRLLTDNGLAFNPSRRGVVGQLVAHLTALGVEPITGKPYRPTTQGKNERFHQTLFRYLDKQPLAGTLAELQQQIDRFDVIYNTERPHQALAGRITPQQAWDATPKATAPRPKPDAELRAQQLLGQPAPAPHERVDDEIRVTRIGDRDDLRARHQVPDQPRPGRPARARDLRRRHADHLRRPRHLHHRARMADTRDQVRRQRQSARTTPSHPPTVTDVLRHHSSCPRRAHICHRICRVGADRRPTVGRRMPRDSAVSGRNGSEWNEPPWVQIPPSPSPSPSPPTTSHAPSELARWHQGRRCTLLGVRPFRASCIRKFRHARTKRDSRPDRPQRMCAPMCEPVVTIPVSTRDRPPFPLDYGSEG